MPGFITQSLPYFQNFLKAKEKNQYGKMELACI